jgi:sugar phosphate isomerase/epimerase
MPGIPDLSVQLYSVRRPIAADFKGTLARLADIGLTRVEPYDLLANGENLKTGLTANGLSAPTAHQALDTGDLEAIFELAAELGVGTVIHPYTPSEQWQTRQDVQKVADLLSTAAAVAAPHGVKVAYHNHDWELSNLIDGRSVLEVLTDLIDPTILLELDTYWAATAGQDVPALLGRLGQRVIALHLKDGPLNGVITDQLPLGQGEVHVPEIVAAATFVEVPVLEFDEYAGDIFDGIAASYAYATSTLGAQR